MLYPHGYGTRMVPIDELFTRSQVDKMHPEYARRLRAWIIAQRGRIGIGGAWRPAGGQPDKPGFAPEGRSFHQTQRFRSGIEAFCAVDLVAVNHGRVHRSPTWDEVPRKGSTEAKQWGLHCNVKGEPWHMQPIEIDGYLTWTLRLRPEPAGNYPLPETRRTLKRGDAGPDVRMAQHIMATKASQPVKVDGDFGRQTETAVINIQRFFQLAITKQIDPPTWAVLDFLNSR